MANPTPTPTSDYLKKLQWENQGGFLVANDGRCLYMRETMGSIIAGVIFGSVLSIGGIGCGIWALTQEKGADAKGFGIFVLLIGLFFLFIMIITLRRGRVLIIYDREYREIRWQRKSLSADRVRTMTTRESGGKSVSYMVAAELNDGGYEMVGPTGASTWPMHWAKQAADWMGLPYR